MPFTQNKDLNRDAEIFAKDKRVKSVEVKGSEITVETHNLDIHHTYYGTAKLGKLKFIIDFESNRSHLLVNQIWNLTFGRRAGPDRYPGWVTPFISTDEDGNVARYCCGGALVAIYQAWNKQQYLEYLNLVLDLVQRGDQTTAIHGEKLWFPNMYYREPGDLR